VDENRVEGTAREIKGKVQEDIGSLAGDARFSFLLFGFSSLDFLLWYDDPGCRSDSAGDIGRIAEFA
jgi:hypothetical protein